MFRTQSPSGNHSLELISNNASALGSELKRSKEESSHASESPENPLCYPLCYRAPQFLCMGGGGM